MYIYEKTIISPKLQMSSNTKIVKHFNDNCTFKFKLQYKVNNNRYINISWSIASQISRFNLERAVFNALFNDKTPSFLLLNRQ